MDKIKAKLRKLQSKVTIKMNKQPLIVTLIWLLVINIIILSVSAIIATILDPIHFPNFFTAFAKGSFKWMISPNSINYIEGNNQVMLLAGIVVVIEIILFSGTIIALTTNGLRTYFIKKTQAKGKLILQDHLIILNWNSKVAEVLNDLRYKGNKISIIILSDKDKDYVKSKLNSIQLDNKSKANKLDLIVRKGDPYSTSDLNDICINDAKSIIIMAEENYLNISSDNLSQIDLNSLKLLLLIGSFNLRQECNIVVEVEAHKTEIMLSELSKTVKSLNNKSISCFSFNRKLGQIIAQTVFKPRLASVYVDLFSFKGEEFYATEKMNIEDYLANFTNSIPIICYNKLFVLAKDLEALGIQREKPYYTNRRLTKAKKKKNDKMTLFVIGENKKSTYMFDNLKRKDNTEFDLKAFDKNDNKQLITSIKETTGKKVVLILSDDSVENEIYDANVFYTLIHLHNNFYNNQSISFITEILDPRNVTTLKDFNVQNAIVSNQLISLIITQMVCNKDSKQFFEQLLLIDNEEEEGFDIIIENVEDILDMKQNLTFNTRAELINSFYYSFDKQCMLIGLIKDNTIEYLSHDMDKKINLTLKKGNQLIFVKY